MYSEAKRFYLYHLNQRTSSKNTVNTVQCNLNDIFIKALVFYSVLVRNVSVERSKCINNGIRRQFSQVVPLCVEYSEPTIHGVFS
jgi:hypothetical protein